MMRGSLAILVGMGLASFAVFMMAADFAFVPDDEYRPVHGAVRSSQRSTFRPYTRPLPTAPW